VLFRSRKFAEAIAPLEEAIDRDPYNPQTFNFLGLAQMATGDVKPAEKNLKKALELDSDFVQAWNNLGYLNLSLYVKRGEEKYYDEAIQDFDAALDRRPGLASAVKGRDELTRQKALIDGPDRQKGPRAPGPPSAS
jgi:tetratricopeptide (TPR) repeat protein